jgi:hypothetical protein
MLMRNTQLHIMLIAYISFFENNSDSSMLRTAFEFIFNGK